MSRQDDAVRSTNDDAASCKRSAVQLGYWSDPYVQLFVRAAERKPPEINRGYYARVTAIRQLVTQFIELTKRVCQVVNLGAGFDTLFWVLSDSGLAPRTWVDVDFESITTTKVHYIQGMRPLHEKLAAPEFMGSELHSVGGYHLVSCDLRRSADVMAALDTCGMDRSLPTAFIAECVLVYMPASDSTALLHTLTQHYTTAFFVNYEQVNMGDKFGQVMMENLQLRGCTLAGAQHCMSLQTQQARFLSTGWQLADAMHMLDVYKSLPQADIARIERLEMLDDYDMLVQLFEHYCVTWACTDRANIGLKAISLRVL
jgi:[phosphatase 2A protein]-leucine-carboxy methyltransferase